MKHLEILIVGRRETDGLGDDDQVVTTAPEPEAAVRMLREQGLGFDAVVVEPSVEPAFVNELRSHRDTANTPLVRVLAGERRHEESVGYDATLESGYDRRALRDAVHHAMNQRGIL